MGTTDGSWTGTRLGRLSLLAEMARLGAVLFKAGRPVHLWIWSRLNWPVWLPLWRLSSPLTGREPKDEVNERGGG